MVGGFGLAELLAAAASIVVIDAGPAHQGCPNLETTRQKVVERVRPPEQDAGEWSARYVVTQSSAPGDPQFVRLELVDPRGRVRLRRELSIEGETCDSVAEAIALVLERYFAELASELPPGDEPEPVAEPVAPPPAPVAVSSTTPVAKPEPRRTELFVGAGTALLLPDPDAAVDLQFRARFSSFSLGLRGAVPPHRRYERLAGGGSAELESVPVRASLAALAALGAFEFELGPELLASIEHGQTDAAESGASLMEAGGAFRLVLGLGLQAGALLPVSERFGVSLAAGVDYLLPLSMSQFLIDDSPPREVLKPHVFAGFVALGPIFIFP